MVHNYSPDENESNWANIIADAIETNLSRLKLGEVSQLTFVDDVARLDETLYDPANLSDQRLSAAWNFADSYFDASWHGFTDLDGICWTEATAMLERTVQSLRNGSEITDPEVLRYS